MAEAEKVVAKPKSRIPPISERRLQTLAEHIHPMVRMAHGRWKQYKTHGTVVRRWFEPSPAGKLLPYGGGEPYLVRVEDLRQSNLMADPKPLKKAADLQKVHVMGMLYPAEANGPTAAHVLAQIPRRFVNDVKAYEVIRPYEVTTEPDHKLIVAALYA
jgi:hypothetical protein